MAFALPLLVQLFDVIDGTVQWLGGASTPQPRTERAPAAHMTAPASHLPAAHPSAPAHTAQRRWGGPTRMSGQRPLRVVRLAEQRRAQAAAGRMAISGRMADVCAELDRLAEFNPRR